MLVTLEEAKHHLRVDTDDDDAQITLLIQAAEEFIRNMTGKMFDSTNALAKTSCLFIISDMYENRTLNTDKVGEKVRAIVTMILTQLSLSYGGELQ